MLFNSVQFLLFFPAVTLFYFVLPHRVRYVWLLASSYYFYMCWNPRYALLMAASTLITYASGILITAARSKRAKQAWVAASFGSNLAILFFFKYFNFAARVVSAAFGVLGIAAAPPHFDVLLPVGISFYTFQALSYTADVYRGDTPCEKNVLRYALFVSFFPQLVAGPIERSSHLLEQLRRRTAFDFARAKSGVMLMLWGYFEKVVVADRVAVAVNRAFEDYAMLSGASVAVGVVLFAVQIYCDFAGYSDIAIGAARVYGIDLMLNFRRPYFAQSVQEFWRRWHISLSTWFRDYLYIPLGGSRCGTLRRYLNVMIVFLASGLWHGASGTFVVWGFLHGAMQVAGGVTANARARARRALGIREDSAFTRCYRRVFVFALVCLTYVFFRAPGIGAAAGVLRALTNPWRLSELAQGGLPALDLGLTAAEWTVLLASAAALWLVDALHERGVCIGAAVERWPRCWRWFAYIAAVLVLVVFGVYGPQFDASRFLYFQF